MASQAPTPEARGSFPPIAPRTEPFEGHATVEKKTQKKRKGETPYPRPTKETPQENKAWCPICYKGFTAVASRNTHLGKPICFKTAVHRRLVEQTLSDDAFQKMVAARRKEISSNKLSDLRGSSERFLSEEAFVGGPRGSGSRAPSRTSSLAIAHATVASQSPDVDRPLSLQRGASYASPAHDQQWKSTMKRMMAEPLVVSTSASSMPQRTMSHSTSMAQHADRRQLQLQASTSLRGYDDGSAGRSQGMSVAYGQAASHEMFMASGQTTFSMHQGGPAEAERGSDALAMGGGAVDYPYQPQPPQFQPGPSQPWSYPGTYAQTDIPQFQAGPSQTWSTPNNQAQTEMPQFEPAPSQHWSIPDPQAQSEIDPSQQLWQSGSSQVECTPAPYDFDRDMREYYEVLVRDGLAPRMPVEMGYNQGSQLQPEFLPPHQPEFLPPPEEPSPPSSVYYHQELVPTAASLTRAPTLPQTLSWQSQESSGSCSAQVQNAPTQHFEPNDSSLAAVPGLSQAQSTLRVDYSWTISVPNGTGGLSRIPSYHLPQTMETPDAPLAPTSEGGAPSSAVPQYSSEAPASSSSWAEPASSSTSAGRQSEGTAETFDQPRNGAGSSESGAAIAARTYSPDYSSTSASTPNDSPSGVSTASSDVGPDTPSDTCEEEVAGKDEVTSQSWLW
ncbi:hypothetical protein C8R47DRAFT_456485 [Mycena vitilis]|nr:hypothetical protein C8R47DRAFT_456485 [Mycena vitilis]